MLRCIICKIYTMDFGVILFSLVTFERSLYAYNEFSRLRFEQMKEIGTIESCHRLDYRDITREHIDSCENAKHRLNLNIMMRVLTNTINNNILYRPVTADTVVEILLTCICTIILGITYRHIHMNITNNRRVLPTTTTMKRIKNE